MHDFKPVLFLILVGCSLIEARRCRPSDPNKEPEFDGWMKSVRVKEGSAVTLICPIKNFQDYKTMIAWIHPNGIFNFNTRLPEKKGALTVYWKDCDKLALQIDPVNWKHDGTYRCQINTRPPGFQEATLKVYQAGDYMYPRLFPELGQFEDIEEKSTTPIEEPDDFFPEYDEITDPPPFTPTEKVKIVVKIPEVRITLPRPTPTQKCPGEGCPAKKEKEKERDCLNEKDGCHLNRGSGGPGPGWTQYGTMLVVTFLAKVISCSA